MRTDKCAANIAEGKHGDFAEQNQNQCISRFLFSVHVRSSLETTLIVNTILLSLIVLIAQIYMLA